MLTPIMKFSSCAFYVSVILMLLALAGCSKHEPGAWRNDSIDASVRGNFSELNHTLFDGLKAKQPKLIENIMSKGLLQDNNIVRVIELCSIRINRGNATLLDEYYMVQDFNRENSIPSGNHGINSYVLNYQPTTREMYAAFYVVKDGAEKWLLSAVYNKLKYGWKLCELEINPYTINGKTAPEHYLQAMKQYQEGFLSNAMSSLEQARNCSTPNVRWRYAAKTKWINYIPN